ncbi:MAG: acetyl-CoA hydrolase/transferase C-terminal domain-containing protein [Bacteroidia bacterium]|nr:acetyl-CoA hydrolase/transferase C-terminal domain-containing protein [Bacteroidia bacterium]
MPVSTTAQEAVGLIQSGNRVFIQGAAMTPHQLIKAMIARAPELEDVEVVHIHTEGDPGYASPEHAKSFRTRSLFVGGNLRSAVNAGYADYIPVFLSDIPLLIRSGRMPVDVAMIQVSPPDQHGYCSMGCSVDVALSAVQTARYVIAQVNPNTPRTLGDGVIPYSRLDAVVEVHEPLVEYPARPLTPVEQKIGAFVADLVEDGATLQMGIGSIPDAVLARLGGHKGLGVHTEMFSDGLMDLIRKGVVTNEHKKVLPNRVVTGFIMGTRTLYDFVHDNPIIAMKDTAFTNDTSLIRKNPKATAINSALEIDLVGQICADTIGTMQFSGVGGQVDFMRGSALSEGGKPIIALPSTTTKGETKIVPTLKPGATVTTSRAHVHYVVTEYGVADLFGRSLKERARALIEIAHPDHREALERAAADRFKHF